MKRGLDKCVGKQSLHCNNFQQKIMCVTKALPTLVNSINNYPI